MNRYTSWGWAAIKSEAADEKRAHWDYFWRQILLCAAVLVGLWLLFGGAR